MRWTGTGYFFGKRKARVRHEIRTKPQKSVGKCHLCGVLNLAVDIGNTRTKLGVFDRHTPVDQVVWSAEALADLPTWAAERGVERVLVSSVAATDLASLLLGFQKAGLAAYELTAITPLPFENTYRTPHTLGKDRLAAVAGAQVLASGCDCVVIDCGTCIKYEALSADGRYFGGNIAPGLYMRTQAMQHFTARLPVVPLAVPTEAIGFDTQTALQNGAFRGALLEMEGFVRLFEQKMKTTPRVVLTGGDAEWVAQQTDLPWLQAALVEPNLVLIGLNAILQNL
jgi:type III pantothenate kinase